jgi:hypothetical protein
MADIEVTITFGNQRRKVSIIQPSGAVGSYHIMIDNYYIGQIVRQQEEFLAFLNRYPDLTGDDIQIIFDMIEEEENKKPRT